MTLVGRGMKLFRGRSRKGVDGCTSERVIEGVLEARLKIELREDSLKRRNGEGVFFKE